MGSDLTPQVMLTGYMEQHKASTKEAKGKALQALQAECDWSQVLYFFLLLIVYHNWYLAISQGKKKKAFGSGLVSSMKLLSWCVYLHLCIYKIFLFIYVSHVSSSQGLAEQLFQHNINMIVKPLTNFHTLRSHKMGHLRDASFWSKPPIPRDDQEPQQCCKQEAGQEDNSTKTQLLVSHWPQMWDC